MTFGHPYFLLLLLLLPLLAWLKGKRGHPPAFIGGKLVDTVDQYERLTRVETVPEPAIWRLRSEVRRRAPQEVLGLRERLPDVLAEPDEEWEMIVQVR